MTQVNVKKRASRKNKRAWRKNIDHQDVDNFLEEQRLEERIGKVSEKTDAELFVVDVKPKVAKVRHTIKERRQLLANKKLRSLEALENTSKVQDPLSQRDKKKAKDQTKSDIIKTIEKTNAEMGILPLKQVQSQWDRMKAIEVSKLPKGRKAPKKFDKDVWGISSDREMPGLKNQWHKPSTIDHHLRNWGKPVVKTPGTTHQKRSKLIAISAPHPGISYNPSLKAHKDLLQKVIDTELVHIKKADHLSRVTTGMFSKMTAKQKLDMQIKEWEEKEEEAVKPEEEVSDNEYMPVNPPVENKKKLRKARRKQHEQKELMQRLLLKKLEKKKITDIHRLKVIKGEIAEMEANLEEMKDRKLQRVKEKAFKAHRLGKQQFEEEDVPLITSDDLSGSLRNVTVGGSILKDRFKSMQLRNIIAPSVDAGIQKRAPCKRFVRNTHKGVVKIVKNKEVTA